MNLRLLCIGLIVCLSAGAAAGAGIAFLPETTREQAIAGPPALDLLTWELPEGLLIADRTGAAGQTRLGEALKARYDASEWFLVYRPQLARGRSDAGDPAAFGHVHFAGETAWVVEVPRGRLDDFYAAAFRLNHLDLTPLAPPAADKAPAAPDRAAQPLPATVDPAVKQAFVDAFDLAAFSQLIREISGNVPLWFEGQEHTVATRYYNTAGNDIAAGYMAQILAGYGYTVELDSFVVNGHVCRNVVATRQGVTYPAEYVVVCGHYDSISQNASSLAPGAEDNASGTSLVMEVARISAGRQFDRSVQFVLFDAEELGLHGSYHFVQDAVYHGRQINAAINADMVAYYDANYAVIIEGQPAWEWLMATMAANVATYTEIGHRKDYQSWGSDHVPFQQAGIAAFLAIDWDYAAYPFYHTTSDGWRRIQATAHLGQQIGRAAAATLADVAGLLPIATGAPDAPLPLVRLEARPNPFNPRATIAFRLAVPASGKLAVYDLRGREVATLAAGQHAAGEHTFTWDGTTDAGGALPSGVYVCRLRTTAGAASLKLNLVR